MLLPYYFALLKKECELPPHSYISLTAFDDCESWQGCLALYLRRLHLLVMRLLLEHLPLVLARHRVDLQPELP
jgi:hypothetical protein